MAEMTDYTTAAEVRSVIGASDKDVRDQVIYSKARLTGLLEAMADLAPDLEAKYLELKAVTSPTEVQARFVRQAESFFTYTVALALIPIMPTLIPKRISDGKNEGERVENPFELVKPAVEETLAYIRTRLASSYQLLTGSAPVAAPARANNVSAVSLGTDPVLGS